MQHAAASAAAAAAASLVPCVVPFEPFIFCFSMTVTLNGDAGAVHTRAGPVDGVLLPLAPVLLPMGVVSRAEEEAVKPVEDAERVVMPRLASPADVRR